MTRLSLGLFALSAFACTPTLYVHPVEPGAEETVREAGELLGVRTKVVDAPEGAVTVEFRSYDGHCGRVEEKATCTPRLWSCESPGYLAHELGHVFGLEHDSRDDNLMNPAPAVGAEIDEKQRWKVQAAVAAMEGVCR